MAYKRIRRRMKQEVIESEGADRKASHAPDLSQIQTERNHMTADDALVLQDVIGNRAVTQLTGATPSTASTRTGYVQPKAIPAQPMRPGGSLNAPAYAHLRSKLAIQPKLSVGAVHDPSEQEADRVASQVTDSHSPANQVQEKPQIQRASWDGSFDTNADFENQVNQQRGGGKPLPSDVRADLEPKFGADFSGVKVHTDAKAAQLSQDVGAQAFTHGSDIYFNQGKYNPESSSGKHLLAHELTHTVQQGGSGANVAQTAIQRKSDKLKTRATYLATAKSGFKLGTTQYDKIFNAVNVYHGLGANNYMAQLQQLVRISAELNLWEISHGLANTNQANKNNKEAARRGVLTTLKSTDLPQEIADVYQQAKNNGNQPDVHLLMQLMDATAGNPGVRGVIEQDYATALRTYQATQNDTLNAENILTAQGSTFFAGAGGNSLSSKLDSVRNLDADPSSGRMSEDIMDAPIRQNDSDTLKQVKKLRQKLVPLVPAIANMTDMEIMAISAYTDEGGYTPMVGVLRGGDPVAGGSKNARKANAKSRAEIQQANLMASSGLNKLPDWDGSTVYRGEGIGWLGKDPANGDVVVLKSFTSTTLNEGTASGFASKGTAQTSAVWCINGVTNQGKDISKLSVVQQEVGIGSGINAGMQEDEILLKPYTRLRIDRVTQGNGYRWHIEATAL